MPTITLEPDVAAQVESLAAHSQVSREAVVDKALRAYFSQYRREKIRAEQRVFDQQRAQLLVDYPGQYVAMHNGAIIDHDADLRTLHLRVYARLGHTPVLLKLVTDTPERDLVFRSPRLVEGV
jgi:diadenosine tetraphosphatase ApaH/serine/threonine PP2A family protein phosphatase